MKRSYKAFITKIVSISLVAILIIYGTFCDSGNATAMAGVELGEGVEPTGEAEKPTGEAVEPTGEAVEPTEKEVKKEGKVGPTPTEEETLPVEFNHSIQVVSEVGVVSGVSVTIKPSEKHEVTDDLGYFPIKIVTGAAYTVELYKEGYKRTAIDVTLETLQIPLEQLEVFEEVNGVVLCDKTPIEGAQLKLERKEEGFGSETESRMTTSGGAFTLHRVVPDNSKIIVKHKDYQTVVLDEITQNMTIQMKPKEEYAGLHFPETERTIQFQIPWAGVNNEYTYTVTNAATGSSIMYYIESTTSKDLAIDNTSGTLYIKHPGRITVKATQTSEEYKSTDCYYTLEVTGAHRDAISFKTPVPENLVLKTKYYNNPINPFVKMDWKEKITYTIDNWEPLDPADDQKNLRLIRMEG